MSYRRFVLLSHLRSGTHMLRSALESHPAIVCQTEVFNSDDPNLPYPLETPTEEILRHWVFKPFPSEIQAVGFALQSYHPGGLAAFADIRENPVWADVWSLLAKMDGLQVIHLKRRNLLARHLSHLTARSSGRWHDWDPTRVDGLSHLHEPAAESAEPSGSPRYDAIYVDPQRLRTDFKDIERVRSRAEHDLCMHPILDVFYEDACEDFHSQMKRVLEFLGCEPVPVTTATRKLEQSPLAERISNYAELKEIFASTKWSQFFEQ